MIAPFSATGENILVVKTVRVIYSSSPCPRMITLIQIRLGDIFIPYLDQRSSSVRLENIGQKSGKKSKDVVNIENIENELSHRMWICISYDNINKVGECLDTITHVEILCIVVLLKSINTSIHVRYIQMLRQRNLENIFGESLVMDNQLHLFHQC